MFCSMSLTYFIPTPRSSNLVDRDVIQYPTSSLIQQQGADVTSINLSDYEINTDTLVLVLIQC